MIRTLVIAALAGLVLASCAGAPTRFYTLDPYPGRATGLADYTGPSFRIDAVHVPPAFDRVELVREANPNHLVVSDDDHWAAPLDELFRRVLTQDLATRFPNGKVVFPDAPKPNGAGGVVVDILAIDHSAGAVVMEVSWTVLPPSRSVGAQDKALAPRQRTARISATERGGGIRDVAAELSGLADQLAAAIAADLCGRPS